MMPDTENKTDEQVKAQIDAEKKQAQTPNSQPKPQTEVQHTSYGVTSESEEAKKTRSTLPSADRNKAYDNIRKYAEKHGGLCEGFVDAKTGEKIVDPNTGKPYTAEALIAEIEYRNASKVDDKGQVVEKAHDWQIKAPGIGANGSDSFDFVGNDSKTVQQKKKEEEKKKEEGSWWSRNWKWLTATIAGVVAIGGIVGWLVHKHNKKKKAKAAEAAKKEVETKVADVKKDTKEVTTEAQKQQEQQQSTDKTQSGAENKTPDTSNSTGGTPSTGMPPATNVTPTPTTPTTPQTTPQATPQVKTPTPTIPQVKTPTPTIPQVKTPISPTPTNPTLPETPVTPKPTPSYDGGSAHAGNDNKGPSTGTTSKSAETTTKPAETTTKSAETTTKSAETTMPPSYDGGSAYAGNDNKGPSTGTTSKSAETTTKSAETTTKSVETTTKPAETATKSAETTTKSAETTMPPSYDGGSAYAGNDNKGPSTGTIGLPTLRAHATAVEGSDWPTIRVNAGKENG